MEQDKKKEKLLDNIKSAEGYEMDRCIRNQSKEEVVRRLKRSAMPVAVLAIFIVIAFILK